MGTWLKPQDNFAAHILVVCPTLQLSDAVHIVERLDREWKGALDLYITRDNRVPVKRHDWMAGFENVTLAYQKAQQMFLKSSIYDAMLTIESDIVFPTGGLKRLWDSGADIAYGLYVYKNGASRGEWSLATDLGTTSYVPISAMPDLARAAWGKCVPCVGIGHGFTLIRRKTLETIKIRRERGDQCADWQMALDAGLAGLTQMCDTSVVCGHVDAKHKVILWPDPMARGLCRRDPIRRGGNSHGN